MQCKRKLERFNLKAPAKIITIDSNRKKSTFDLVTCDICAGGAFFHTSCSIPEGTQVEVAVALNLDKLEIMKDYSKQVHLRISGKVVRTKTEGMAVCFGKDYQISQFDSSA
jgi:hypothetical protein